MTRTLKRHFFFNWLLVGSYLIFGVIVLVMGRGIHLSPGIGFAVSPRVLFLEKAPSWTLTAEMIDAFFRIALVIASCLLFFDEGYLKIVPGKILFLTAFGLGLAWIGLHLLLSKLLLFTPLVFMLSITVGEAVMLVLLRLLYHYRKRRIDTSDF